MTVDNKKIFFFFFGNGTEFVSPSFKDCKAYCSAVKATNSLFVCHSYEHSGFLCD